MSKLIPMEEAAKFLGMSVDQLNELRENNEVFGYRDGTTWKFKMSELERVAGQSGINIGDAVAGGATAASSAIEGAKDALGIGGSDEDSVEESGELSFDIDDSISDLVIDEEDSDSIAMEDSSLELFQPPGATDAGAGTSSDILSLDDDDGDDDGMLDFADSGLLVKSGSKSSLLDDENDSEDSISLAPSELNLVTDEDVAESKKELDLDDVGSFKLAEDDSVLDDEGELSFGSSSLVLASESGISSDSPSTGDDLLDDVAKASGSPSDTGNLFADDDDDDLMLANDDLDLELADSGSFDSDLSSSLDESAELVLDDSSDDLILEANDSGIALSPNESGIMLGDEPLELGGSDIDDLELPDDDDISMGGLGDDGDSLLQEDDFSLTPHELNADDDESSGSQVIALADSEIYTDDSEATMLGGSSEFSEPAMLDDSGLGGEYDAGMVAAGTGMMAKTEAPYSIGQIVALSGTVLSLFIGCIIAYGMAQNLWLPDDQVVNSGLMNMLLDAFGLKS
jgi:hypothetical protein